MFVPTAIPPSSAGARLRSAVAEERPLQVVGAINAYTARLAQASGFRALYLSGGGVAANSLGLPDLGISSMEDVLVDIRRITDACPLPLLVDADTGWGGAFNIARTVRSFIKGGAAGLHIEDQVQSKRCGHRPGKALVSAAEMVDRIRAAADGRSDGNFVIMARTDAHAYPHSHSNSHPDTYSYSYANSHSHSNSHPDAHACQSSLRAIRYDRGD